MYFQKLQQFICKYFFYFFQIIPIFKPFHILIVFQRALHGLIIMLVILLLSLIITFDLDIYEYQHVFKYSFIAFTADILINLNTGIILKGNVILNRETILRNYLKQYFLKDIISIIPLGNFVVHLNIDG